MGQSHLHSSLNLFQVFLLGMRLFLLSSLQVYYKESEIRFLQTHKSIHNQRFCRNGQELHLSTFSDKWKCKYFLSGKSIRPSSIYFG